jgi:hypothetical protein
MKKIIIFLFGVATAAFLFNQIDNAVARELSGNDFLNMEEKYQAAYVSGFWDGARVCCEVEEANDDKCKFRDLMKFMDGVKLQEMVELINKYIKDNPSKAHKPLGFLFYKYIEEASN